MNYTDPSFAIGLLVMGMALGALLTHEFYRRNIQSAIEHVIEQRALDDGLEGSPTHVDSQRKTRPPVYEAVRLSGGHSPGQAN